MDPYNKWIALEDERDAVLEKARRIVSAAEQAGRVRMTAEETERCDALTKSAADLKVKARAAQAEYNASINKPDPQDNVHGLRVGGAYDSPRAAITSPNLESRSYRAMFGEAGLDNGGFSSMEDFMRSIHYGDTSRLAEVAKRGMTEGVPSDGGYAVPGQWAATVFDLALENEVVRPRARLFPMKSKSLHVPGTVIGSHASSTIAGEMLAYWADEASTVTEKTPKFRSVELRAKKLMAHGTASNEVISDGVGFEETVIETFANAVSFKLDQACLTGDGAGKPLGVRDAACTLTQAKEGGQSANTVVYENLTGMLSLLHPACFKRACWVASSSTIPQLLELSVAIGTGGSHVPVMTESNGAFKMLTLPVVFSEKMPVLGDAADVMLCDFSQYAIGLRKELAVDKSGHPHFSSDQTDYRAIIRVDGQPLWDEALTLTDGSTQQSCFVKLAERA